MSKQIFERFKAACDYNQAVDVHRIETILTAELSARRCVEYGSLQNVTAAWAARASWDAWAARASWDAWAARDARAVRAARDACYYAIGSVHEEQNALIFLTLLEAGCWLLFDLPDDVIGWVRIPMLVRTERGLHCSTGPAFRLPEQEEYFWHGVLVTQQIVMEPDTLTPKQIAKETNAQVRQVMVERIGIERVCQMFKAQCLDKRGEYELLALNLGDGRIRPYLKMLNPSMPGIYHIEGVLPTVRTVREALNWRVGLTPEMIDEINGAEWYEQGDVILKPKGAKTFKSSPTILT